MRQLSQMEGNCFTPELIDVIIIPEGAKSHMFIVMETVQSDLKKVLESSAKITFDEGHTKVLLYNGLTCLNFLHSSNVMHRDIKPSNLLVDENCQIKLCDFGFAR